MTFDLHPDRRRFAVLKHLATQAEAKPDHLTLLFNFADELSRMAPARKQ